MSEQPKLPTLQWPALQAGPVFLCFELQGVPGHKGRHRSRLVVPKDIWVGGGIPARNVKRIFIHQYPDPKTEAYEKELAQAARLFMRGRSPTERPVKLVVHSFRPIPESWSKRDKERARAGNILPTTKPDWDNYGKITDALNGIVWKDDSFVCDGRCFKLYSDTPALRIEIREFIEPAPGG